ncbi:hypothetical protein EVAR_97519_1 [Eumeta japonica]|uniref:Uncharacterized protein n=1 Tax=Eumeta variegata TaxID=151549 RepID=A0A4C1WP01_EUMVA|nr:hypothetical protein EVAR_97519_1 [Eumeta japonica]
MNSIIASTALQFSVDVTALCVSKESNSIVPKEGIPRDAVRLDATSQRMHKGRTGAYALAQTGRRRVSFRKHFCSLGHIFKTMY